MRQLIAGNWKMNGETAALAEIAAVVQWVGSAQPAADVLICPPATLVARAAAMTEGWIAIGGQDCRPEPSGAYTGDISAEMLKDAGASAVIVGHSERRLHHGETDGLVAAKARGAWRAGLLAIVCIGETEAERKAGHAKSVVARQLAASIPSGATAATTAIAYEPVWAIGTGLTPTVDEIADMHAHIRDRLGAGGRGIRILYGGSVRPENARQILGLPDVGGALAGGASLKAADFRTIAEASSREP